ncbi:MAG TPA: hemolysin family protein [Candidatus Lachnoclostridium stercoripullorum]|uniref:Hemolysin family protein n=1 Tax=Candidatus Lachnoclostridium stercoripullorum TaxID=2838635 RepID=A0A9D1W785_9FIRM|nr:hemolysin family protein [Candidatus Lachnoclostridium stercoripullorum]
MNISLIIIVCCIIMSAYFSATETAFSSLNRVRMKSLAEKGNKRAALVLRLSENYDSLLSTILIGNNIVNITSTSVATVLFVRLLGEERGSSLSTLVMTIVVLIFGEVSPKSLAKEVPENFALFSAPILRVLVIILSPANFLFGQWKKLLSLIFKFSRESGITEEELLIMVEEAKQDGGIDEQEGTLIRSAIEFSDLTAEDVLTPRIDVAAVPADATQEEIADIFTETGFSRLPVYRENVDNIVGIIYQKDFYNQIYHTERKLEEIIRPALFIAMGKKVGQLLKELQQKKMHIAVVLDEFGGTAGIVTLEDILEELVGEIWDEHDKVVQEVEQISDGEYLVMGSANVEKLFERLGKEREFDVLTVSGWVMEVAEKIPAAGEQFRFEDLEITVLEMDDKRVEKVRIVRTGEKLPNEKESVML